MSRKLAVSGTRVPGVTTKVLEVRCFWQSLAGVGRHPREIWVRPGWFSVIDGRGTRTEDRNASFPLPWPNHHATVG